MNSIFQPSRSARDELELQVGAQNQSMAAPVLVQYWLAVLRWKWVILAAVFASLVIGLVLTLLATPQYTATSRIEISREDKRITSVEAVESIDAGQNTEFYQTQYALLEAKSLASRVVRQLRLTNDENFFDAHGVSPAGSAAFFDDNAGDLSASGAQAREKQAVSLLREHISIAPVRGSALVEISYTSADPALSARVANAWTQQFIESSIDRRFASTADARKFLEQRLAELRTRLEESERDLVNYASEKGIVTLGSVQGADGRTQSGRTLAAADLEALNSALSEAISDRIAAQSKARVPRGLTSAADANNSTLADLRQIRAETAAEYAKLMVQFEPGYPQARALAEEIEVLDSSIAREESRVAGSRDAAYREALARESDLRRQVAEYRTQYDSQQRNSIQYNIFQREADTNRELYDALLQRYKEIGVAGVAANNIAVVDTASIPSEPSSPNLVINMLIALLAGMGLAGAIVFALEQIDEGIREPGQVERLLQQPLLGSVPDVEDEDALEQLADAKSSLSEAYLSIRSNLAFSSNHGVPRSIMMTSARPAEGKSTSSLAIATILGRTGKKVLLVDGDMRSPSMYDFVGVEVKNGLSNYLAGEDDWRSLVVDTEIPNLSLLPAGPMPPSAAELLSSSRISHLVKALASDFDHIVIDAPPLLGLADAPLLARSVEGCIFVAEAEGVAIRGIKAAISRLEAVNANILGVVLTKLSDKKAGYGYGYEYGYGYGPKVQE